MIRAHTARKDWIDEHFVSDAEPVFFSSLHFCHFCRRSSKDDRATCLVLLASSKCGFERAMKRDWDGLSDFFSIG